MTLFLCGFMGCGKSALGKVLSKRLQLPLIDTDDRIVQQMGMSIPQIFVQKGEAFFRETETELIKSLGMQSAVVSCGGGVMVDPVNAAAATKNGGIIVYLQQTFETCYERIRYDTNRPIVQKNTKKQLQALFAQREQLYQAHATDTVVAGNTPEESAERVIQLLKEKYADIRIKECI